jgi:hypothetical protein
LPYNHQLKQYGLFWAVIKLWNFFSDIQNYISQR